MSDQVKRCIECKHYIRSQFETCIFFSVSIPHGCRHENNKSVVDGSLLKTPEELRYGVGCGEGGDWFESNK